MNYFKLQMGCLVFIAYIIAVYTRNRRMLRQKHKFSIYDGLLVVGVLSVFLDGLTAYTVNHLDSVNITFNMILHLLFLLSLDSIIFLLFIYILSTTVGLPKRKSRKIILYTPFLLNVFVVVFFIPSLEYRSGEISNYSMGISAYTCFIMVGVYIALSIFHFIKRWDYISQTKRWSVLTYLLMLAGVALYQMFRPQALVTSICVTIMILGIYLNQENPAIKELNHYHEEMIMGFATLVENKDGSTGGHIKRTSQYVRLLAEELRRRGYYKKVLTKDYLDNLYLAAPMHDIGKIAIPDVILQKPGKLTDEEYDIMKTHAARGGEIVHETFGHLGNSSYSQMAYDVAKYHHEKWNGRGYPCGLANEAIPLSARMMAIADVFDAVSAKRCYRDAMPLDKCFEIIAEGRGTDFEPLLVDIFLSIRPQVEAIYNQSENV